MEGLNLKISQNFVRTEFFLTFVGDKPLWEGGLVHFHYFISLETANTQKSERLLLRVSSANVNTSGVVTC